MAELTVPATQTGAEAPSKEEPKGSAPDRPTWLPEKFKTAEDMAAAYSELEKKQGSALPKDAPAATPPQGTELLLKAKEAGLDLVAMGKEYVANGDKLSKETLDLLASKGIPESTVQTYVAAAKAQSASVVAEITAVAGGEEKRAAVYAWAQTNLSASDIDAYNAILDKADVASSKLAFEGLYSRYVAANGQEPSRVDGEVRSTGGSAQPFASRQEIVKAMKAKDYSEDPAYRAKIDARLVATDFASLK